jgi:NTE family protein
MFAGILAPRWSQLVFDERGVATNFEARIAQPTRKFVRRRADVFMAAVGPVPYVNPAHVLARYLDLVLTHGLTLDQLPDRPRFVINAANLGTGVSFRFSKPYMHDVRLGVICKPTIPLSYAIAASSAFPPFVSPFILDLSGMEMQWSRGADLFDDPRYAALKKRVHLLDGGAYDNLGIEAVDGECRIVLASDAGGSLRVHPRGWRYGFWMRQLRRTLDITIEVSRAQRRRALIDKARSAAALRDHGAPADPFRVTEHVALWRATLPVEEHPLLPEGWSVAPGWREYLSTRPTRMWPMGEETSLRIVNWGYLTSDLVMRSYVPDLRTAPPPEQLPYPEFGFDKPPA